MPIWTLVAIGIASFYDMPGAMMANGQPFDPRAHTCAMLSEPFGERVELLDDDSRRTSWCVITDRGPFVVGRVLDVSPSVRDELGMSSAGLANVRVYRVIGQLPPCTRQPPPANCKTPPHSCVLELPKVVLVRC